jgi:hypothetical protein
MTSKKFATKSWDEVQIHTNSTSNTLCDLDRPISTVQNRSEMIKSSKSSFQVAEIDAGLCTRCGEL